MIVGRTVFSPEQDAVILKECRFKHSKIKKMKSHLHILLLISLLLMGCSKEEDINNGLPSLPDPNDVCSGMVDPIFIAYCLENFDANNDGKISRKEADDVLDIECQEMGIKSVKGIEYFTNLQTLRCFSNELTELDCRYNTKLTVLRCYYNSIATLDLSKNIELVSLGFDGNPIESIDVSKNTRLRLIDCSSTNLTTLNLNYNPSLETLYCRNTQIEKLDFSKNRNFKWLHCSNNPYLESIDLTNCEHMEGLNHETFKDCWALKTVKLPSSITLISTHVFEGCNVLKEIFCPAITPPQWYFYYEISTAYTLIYVPEKSINLYRSAPSWLEFDNILPI